MCIFPLMAHAGGVAGVCGLGHNKSYSSPPTNNAYLCTQGIASSTAYSSGRWVWTCTGSDGSAPTSCSADNCGPAPVAGVCDNSTRNACSAGTANDAAVADTSTQYRWRCDGQNYGANSGTCSMAIPPTPVAGVCNNSTRNACSAGTANDGAIADTTSEYRWRCDGENGGANSGTCSLTKPPAPVAGVCNNSSQNACSAGTANDAAVADTTTQYRWRCDGQNGGANSGTCSLAKPSTGRCGISTFPATATYNGVSAQDILDGCANGYTANDFSYNGMGGSDTRYIVRDEFGSFIVCHNNINIAMQTCYGSTGGTLAHSGSNMQCQGSIPSCTADPAASGTWQQVGIQGCSFQVPAMEMPRHCSSRGNQPGFPTFSPGGACNISAESVDGTCIHGEYAGEGNPYGSCGMGGQYRTRTYECK